MIPSQSTRTPRTTPYTTPPRFRAVGETAWKPLPAARLIERHAEEVRFATARGREAGYRAGYIEGKTSGMWSGMLVGCIVMAATGFGVYALRAWAATL